MVIKIFGSAWGMNPDVETRLQCIREAGFDGVEMGAPTDDSERKKAVRLLKEYELGCIIQVWTAGAGWRDHASSLELQVARASELQPLFVNAQTGRDHFTRSDNEKLLHHAELLERKYGTVICHETHRGRFAYAATITEAYAGRLRSLKLTADFSHWCCVSESLLEDQQDAVKKAAGIARHIHARVGYAEGPQVSDPRAPEWKGALDAHIAWWDLIVANNYKNKLAVQTITPEFGPPAYLHTLPFTNLPVADNWEINCYMKDLLRTRYGNIFKGKVHST